MNKKRELPSWMKGASQRVPAESDTGNTSQPPDKDDYKFHESSMTLGIFPELQFDAKLIYSYNLAECSLLCEDILMSITDELVLGMDMEWPVTYTSGKTSKVAVIQICSDPDTCYIFHIAAMSDFPKPLRCLIADKRVKKVGVNIEGDIWKLARDFDGFPAREIIRESIVELSSLANSVLNSSERWSLDGLCKHLLQKQLNKSPDVRCGRWDVYPLTDQLKRYAATDALASLLVFEELKSRS